MIIALVHSPFKTIPVFDNCGKSRTKPAPAPPYLSLKMATPRLRVARAEMLAVREKSPTRVWNSGGISMALDLSLRLE